MNKGTKLLTHDLSLLAMKKYFSVYFVFFLLLLTQGCMVKDAQKNRFQVVHVYTDFKGEFDSLLFKKFKKEHGIQVFVHLFSKDSILEILKTEKYNSKADLILLSSIDLQRKAKQLQLLQPLKSEKLAKKIPAKYSDRKGYWYALCKSPIVIAYRSDVLSSDTLDAYSDLIKPMWKGKIALGKTNGNAVEVLKYNLQKQNYPDSLVRKLYQQARLEKTGDDAAQLKRISKNEAQLAVVDYWRFVDYQQTNKASKLAVFVPGQKRKGVYYNVFSGSVFRYARNPSNARELMEFLASKSAQYQFCAGRYSFPFASVKTHYDIRQFRTIRGRFVN